VDSREQIDSRDRSKGGDRLLVVADDPGPLAIIAELVRDLGYEVTTAAGRQEAEQHLAADPYALVITTIVAIEGRGDMAFLATIKERNPDIGIIVISDQPGRYSFLELLKYGAPDCLDLPLGRDDLAAKISRVLGEIQQLQSRRDELQTQAVLNGLLWLSMEEYPLPEMLQRFLLLITSFPSLGLKPQGAVMLVADHDSQKLVLAANHNLAPALIQTCAEVVFGHCLCGRAAASGELLFVNHVDERHENQFPGMPEHGHYCVPIKAATGELLGVYTLYVSGNFVNKPVVEETLKAVAAVLATIIRHQRITGILTEREARYRAITDAAMDGIVMMDHQGRISFVNPAVERMFGYSASEAIGQDLHALLALPKYAKEYQPAVAHFLATGTGDALGRTIEVEGRHRDGRELPIELSISALGHQAAWQAVAIVRDISERKRHDAEKDRLNRELQQAYKMDAIGTLAGGIAHDFNNLLTAILGFTDLVQYDLPEDSQPYADLAKVIGAGNRARDLTRQILAFSRQAEQEKIPVKVQLILKEAMKLLRSSIPANISIRQDISQECPSIMADPGQLHQIIMNLCTNAYYAMKESGGALAVDLKTVHFDQEADCPVGLSPGEFVQLTVADSGPGIQPEVAARIFEPFFTTKPQGEGTGMGLAIVHGIVAELGGVIQVASSPGQGAEFRAYFPVATAFNLSLEHLEPGVDGQGNEHILVVDDDKIVLEISTRNLSKLGYAVTPLSSSTEALATFLAMPDKFDLVLTDQAMPDMTGVDLAREILKIRDVPIILLTGFADSATPKMAKEVGILEVLTKPAEHHHLTRAIRRHLQSTLLPR